MAAIDLFTPSDPGFVAHPYDAYAELRRGPRVQYDARTDTWLVPRHADVDALLRDRRLGRTYLHVATHEQLGRPHVCFGAGVHFCLGAPLARLELQTSFGTVLPRLPRLELVEEPRWRLSYVIRGLEVLHVRV